MSDTRLIIQMICALVFMIVLLCLLMLDSKRYPTRISKSRPGESPDCYTVSVRNFTRHGHSFYNQYRFTKRKSGKYRLRHSVWEWLEVSFVTLIFVPLFVWMVVQNLDFIISNPGIGIPIYAGIFLMLTLLGLIILNPIVKAALFFRKWNRQQK